MKKLLMIAACLGLVNLASAQLALEDFDGGTWPPTGWAVVDNIGNGYSWDTSSVFSHGNEAGTGECAAIDSDNYGSVDIDGELITPSFDIPVTGLWLQFDHFFNQFGSELGDVDLSIGGGAWMNLAQYVDDNEGSVGINLSAYAGSTDCQVRFHYYLANYDWYWHVDNVKVESAPPPPVNIWFEDFDSGTWPPVGWAVVDNIGNGDVWDTSSVFGRGNQAGFGECAAIDSDFYGIGRTQDSELITPSFPVNNLGTEFGFDHYFDWLGPEFADVDISVGGGAWTNVLQYVADTEGYASVDLDPYVGMNVELRFRYHTAEWEWYWHVDNAGQFPHSSTGTGTPYCFGDGSGDPCPCGNTGGTGEGCANSTGVGGLLVGHGSLSVAADDLGFDGSGLLPGQGALLFVANNQLTGLTFGDGLRCAGGALIRLGVKVPSATGEATWGPGLGVKGGWAAGDIRNFQLWYRDPVGSPCAFEFNTSNAVNVIFEL